MRKKTNGILLLLPILIGFSVFYIIPYLITIWYSVSFGNGKRRFVGGGNYIGLFENEMFLLAMKNTFCFLAVTVPIILVIAFLLAYLLLKIKKRTRNYELLLLYPIIVPIAAIVLIAKNLWNGNAFVTLCLLYVWKYLGYHVLIFYARMQMIPQVYYENAYMEGAGERNILCSILLPMMKPVIKMNVLLAVMNAFKCYREAFLLGGRHPDDSIYLLQHFMNNNFENLNYQKIASASVVLMGSVLLFVLLDALIGLVRRRNDVGKTV